jgi:hypothetical protein
MGVIPLTAWGTASPAHSSFGRERFDGQGTAVLALIANSPQLLISLIYLFYNQTFTSMAQAYAWNQLGVHRKSLRVSKPAGEQRETYFLHLPLRWGVPLNSISGLLHWLTAQTLFVVRLDHRGRDGTLQVGQSIAACGFSGSGFLAIIVVLLLLLLLATVLALISFEARVPFAGSCSWIISAACHPPRDEVNAALGRVKWGVVLGAGSADDPGHCSFSSGPVKKPKAGRSYK